MKASVVVPIRSSANTWSAAKPSDPSAHVRDRRVDLEVEGNPRDGFHLIMSPDGCFTADTWHETAEEAKDAPLQAFGVLLEDWK